MLPVSEVPELENVAMAPEATVNGEPPASTPVPETVRLPLFTIIALPPPLSVRVLAEIVRLGAVPAPAARVTVFAAAAAVLITG